MSTPERKSSPPLRAGIYVRISSDPTGDELGVRRQEKAARAFCERLGWVVVDVFTDDDRSAYSGKPRPEYLRLLDAIRGGAVDAVVAWHPDRLHRSPRELEDFIDLIEATGAKVATVEAGEYDLATPSGRLAARIVGAVARGESEHKSSRIRAKMEQLAAAGAVGGGGTRPFGYEADRVTVREDEAEAIRDAARQVIAGIPLRRICMTWNEQNITTSTGGAWRLGTLRRMLLSPRIAGLRQHRGEVEAVLIAGDTPQLARALDAGRSEDDAALAEELAAIEADLVAVAEDFGAGRLGRAEWLAVREQLEPRRSAAVAALRRTERAGALEPYAGAQGALRAAWPSLDFDQQRAVIAAAVATVTVGPAVKGRNFFDPARVSVEWRA